MSNIYSFYFDLLDDLIYCTVRPKYQHGIHRQHGISSFSLWVWLYSIHLTHQIHVLKVKHLLIKPINSSKVLMFSFEWNFKGSFVNYVDKLYVNLFTGVFHKNWFQIAGFFIVSLVFTGHRPLSASLCESCGIEGPCLTLAVVIVKIVAVLENVEFLTLRCLSYKKLGKMLLIC